ncbi:MAG: AAA family ATPase [Bacteroidia bacterium]
MILKQINKIQKFGIFENFDWDNNNKQCNAFNLIYGWNYSGKTTLSRIFRCFELGALHPDYPDAKFEIIGSDGNKYNESNLVNTFNIRVFNIDFINQNLKWNIDNEEIEPILLIGQQNIQLQETLDAERKKIETESAKSIEIESKKKFLDDTISLALTEKAGTIRNSLPIPGYNKTHLLPVVEEIISQNLYRIPLEEAEIEKLIETYKSIEKKTLMSTIELVIPNISLIVKNANDLLVSSIKTNVIEKLKSDADLNEWVKMGLILHQEKTKCEFCDNPLPINLLERLSEHFSADYDKMLMKIQEQIRKNEILKINTALPEFGYFYSEFQENYKNLKDYLSNELMSFNLFIDKINTALENKKLKIFESVECIDTSDNSLNINKYLLEINGLIYKHNQKSENIGAEKENARIKLIENYACELIKEQDYQATLNKIKEYDNETENINESMNSSKVLIKSIEKQLSEIVKGAEKINDYLIQYFGKDDIKVIATPQNKFQLQRSSVIAKNLSEGEKTAIAFAYFITKIEDKSTNLADIIVYIDDPISSLDANHLFNTYVKN